MTKSYKSLNYEKGECYGGQGFHVEITLKNEGVLMKNQKFLVGFFIASILLLYAYPMGDNKDGIGDSAFAPLEEGLEDIQGVVIDENTRTELSQISFFGHTTVGGIRCEDNDSMTKFDLSKIRSLKVITPAYASKRYVDKEFALIRKTAVGDGAPQDMLVPRNIMLCGIEKNTGDEKSWKLFQINELKLHRAVGEPEATDSTPAGASTVVGGCAMRGSDASSCSSASKSEKIGPDNVQQPKTIVRDHYKKMEVKVVESKGHIKSIPQALRECLCSIIEVIKSVFNFVKHLFV